MTWTTDDEAPHSGLIDEWVFAAWAPDGSLGVVSGHRLLGSTAWYWSALVEAGRPLLHLTEFEVVVRRADPFIVKAPQMWAEHQIDDPMRQWSIGNEGFFVALDDPADAAGRAYGEPTPVAMDLEWYATADPTAISDPGARDTPGDAPGYEQLGVVHGVIELMDRPNIELAEVPARRWRRWGSELGPLGSVGAAGGVPWARFAFPDGSVVDWHVTARGMAPW